MYSAYLKTNKLTGNFLLNNILWYTIKNKGIAFKMVNGEHYEIAKITKKKFEDSFKKVGFDNEI